MIDPQLLARYASGFYIELDSEMQHRFSMYSNLLLDWNARMNLTAITDPEGIVVKHFLDSIVLLNYIQVPRGASLVDIGSGAGFPGVPLQIVRPDLKVTLLDSLRKRIVFLEVVRSELGLSYESLHLRAEEAGHAVEYRQQFDFAVARAVAPLRILCEYALPLLNQGGSFVALKGADLVQELGDAARAMEILGAGEPRVYALELPGGIKRSIVEIPKISQTPPKYPRTAVKMTKNPL